MLTAETATKDGQVIPQLDVPPVETVKEFEPSPLSRITDARLLEMACCPNFQERFEPGSFEPLSDYSWGFNSHTGGYAEERYGRIHPKEGGQYLNVRFRRDLDNAGVAIIDPASRRPVLHLNLRDRRYDGTDMSTPPSYLRSIGGKDEIPLRSYFVGGTNWYYASPMVDAVEEGRASVEFSITSSDPSLDLEGLLNQKACRLHIDPRTLLSFIDDPFAALPGASFSDGSEEQFRAGLNDWYRMWWQVVNRGLRGKSIPYPGQTSVAGFKGFFKHVVAEVTDTLAEYGYTHLSGVPTWYYVWGMNLHNGFRPDNEHLHRAAARFFAAQEQMSLPSLGVRSLNEERLGDLDGKNPLHSWFAVLPYALELDPEFSPAIGMGEEAERNFHETYGHARAAYIRKLEIVTYPLRPGLNLWHSLPVGNNHGQES